MSKIGEHYITIIIKFTRSDNRICKSEIQPSSKSEKFQILPSTPQTFAWEFPEGLAFGRLRIGELVELKFISLRFLKFLPFLCFI